MEPDTPMLFRPPVDLLWGGVAYGAGLLERAASQSKGIDEDIDGVDAGERWMPKETRLRGVTGVEGALEAGDVELD